MRVVCLEVHNDAQVDARADLNDICLRVVVLGREVVHVGHMLSVEPNGQFLISDDEAIQPLERGVASVLVCNVEDSPCELEL